MAQHKKIQDVLPAGLHQLKVTQAKRGDGEVVEGTGKWGPWWLFTTMIEGEEIGLFANDKTIAYFSKGQVTCDIVTKFDPDSGKPVLKAYYGAASAVKDTPQDTPKEVPKTEEQAGFKTIAEKTAEKNNDSLDNRPAVEDLPF